MDSHKLYIKIIAVKKVVVGFRSGPVGLPEVAVLTGLPFFAKDCVCSLLSVHRIYDIYFEKIRVSKAGYCLIT